MRQLLYLIKQELRSATRSKYILLTFVLMPFLMWGMQGGIQVLIMGSIMEGEKPKDTLYVINYDLGGANYTYGGNNFTNVNLGDLFIESLISDTEKNENETNMANVEVDNITLSHLSYDEIDDYLQHGNVSYLLIIPSDFSTSYNTLNQTVVELRFMGGSIAGPYGLQYGIGAVLAEEPFTKVQVEKVSYVYNKQIEFEGEEAFSMMAGMAAFLTVILSVMAPAPFVSASFAGEREKKTMEGLMALPISRFKILLGKLIAGLVLVSIFTVCNILGMIGFSWMMENMVNAPEEAASAMAIDISVTVIPVLALCMFLSALVSIGIGIGICSLSKDVRTAESTYTSLLMLPAMISGMAAFIVGVPERLADGAGVVLYIIPWSHTVALFNKILYPKFFGTTALFGDIWLDIIFHVLYLIGSIVVILLIAAKIFEREGMLT